MIKLVELDGTDLSTAIRNLSPIYYKGIRVENELLDGTTHLQIIGDPQPYRVFEVLVTESQAARLGEIHMTGEKAKLIVDDKYYTGFTTQPSWERITPRYRDQNRIWYTSSITLSITEEGSI
ncbi:hypothetical protein [Gudongella sp. SC589]|jgi:hypothetical protein|uniref:hypothetical protein n=1 Tax=Gudongella sp. SC589 TaxID=3385990 RepID=UPI0039047484